MSYQPGETVSPHAYAPYLTTHLVVGLSKAIKSGIDGYKTLDDVAVDKRIDIDPKNLVGKLHPDNPHITLKQFIDDAEALRKGPESEEYKNLERQLIAHIIVHDYYGSHWTNVVHDRINAVEQYLKLLQEVFDLNDGPTGPLKDNLQESVQRQTS